MIKQLTPKVVSIAITLIIFSPQPVHSMEGIRAVREFYEQKTYEMALKEENAQAIRQRHQPYSKKRERIPKEMEINLCEPGINPILDGALIYTILSVRTSIPINLRTSLERIP